MTGPALGAEAATRVVLRPLATPLPLGFLALVLATTSFSALQLGWIAPTEGRIVALTALVATVPLQLIAAVLGFLGRDPVAATGMGVLSGTWAVVGLSTLTSPPGAVSDALGVLLVTAGICMAVPALAAVTSKVVPAAVMALAGVRFVVTGIYQSTGSADWETSAGWVGIALAVVAFYAALALEFEGSSGRTLLPVGRLGQGRAAVRGEAPLRAEDLAGESGVRPQL